MRTWWKRLSASAESPSSPLPTSSAAPTTQEQATTDESRDAIAWWEDWARAGVGADVVAEAAYIHDTPHDGRRSIIHMPSDEDLTVWLEITELGNITIHVWQLDTYGRAERVQTIVFDRWVRREPATWNVPIVDGRPQYGS